HRGVRNVHALPPFSEEEIERWARAHYKRTGRWPNLHSGPIQEAPGETWAAVDAALHLGNRGLSGGLSLAKLLAARCGVRTQAAIPRLTIEQILEWVDAYHRRHGRWPTEDSGPVEGVPGETWAAISLSLRQGHRGLEGGSS